MGAIKVIKVTDNWIEQLIEALAREVKVCEHIPILGAGKPVVCIKCGAALKQIIQWVADAE